MSPEDYQRLADALARLLLSAWRAHEARTLGSARAELVRLLTEAAARGPGGRVPVHPRGSRSSGASFAGAPTA